MWHRILALIIKELWTNARDPKTRWVVLFSPPFLLLIYAFAITQDVSNVPVAIFNQDAGVESRELIARLKGSNTFSRIEYLQSSAEIVSAIESKSAAMVIQFGPDFSRKLAANEEVNIQIILDGRRSNTAQILIGYLSQILESYNRERLAERGFSAPTKIVSRIWFNPNLKPIWSAVPSLFAVMTAIVGFMISALTIAREREMGTFEQLLVSPLKPLEILVGKTAPALLVAITSATAMLVLGTLILEVPVRGSLLLLYLSMIIYLASIIGIGLFISSLAATQQQAIVGLFVYMVPAVLISGYATPVENMPDFLQWVAETNPIRHFIVICKAVFLKDAPLSVVFQHSWPMALIAVVTLSSGAWLFRRRVS